MLQKIRFDKKRESILHKKKGTSISCTLLMINAPYGLYLSFSAHRSRVTSLYVAMISSMAFTVETSDSFTAALKL